MNFIKLCLTILCCNLYTVSSIQTKNQDIDKFIGRLLKSEKFIELTSKLVDDIAEKVKSVNIERNMLRSVKKDKPLRTDGKNAREHKRPKSKAPEIKINAHELLEAMRNNPLFKKNHITLKFKDLTNKLQNLTVNKEKQKNLKVKEEPDNAEKDETDVGSEKSETRNDKDEAETDLDKDVNSSFESENDEKQKSIDSSDNISSESIIDDIIDETSNIVETGKDVTDPESRYSESNEKDIGGRKSHQKSLDINIVQRAGKSFEIEMTTVEPIDVDANKTKTDNKTKSVNTEINISAENVNSDADKTKVSPVASTVADNKSYESKKVREENGKLYKYLSSPEYQEFHENVKKEETNSVL